jgi:hypothetical protein
MVNYCLALPYPPGGAELATKFAQENGRTEEHDEFYSLLFTIVPCRVILWIDFQNNCIPFFEFF